MNWLEKIMVFASEITSQSGSILIPSSISDMMFGVRFPNGVDGARSNVTLLGLRRVLGLTPSIGSLVQLQLLVRLLLLLGFLTPNRLHADASFDLSKPSQ